MKESLLDLSGKTKGFEVELFETVAEVAESLSIPFFVVGAMARDIILTQGYGIETGRATQDIDLGVQVSDWDGYERLRVGLIATGKFRRDKISRRYWYPQINGKQPLGGGHFKRGLLLLR